MPAAMSFFYSIRFSSEIVLADLAKNLQPLMWLHTVAPRESGVLLRKRDKALVVIAAIDATDRLRLMDELAACAIGARTLFVETLAFLALVITRVESGLQFAPPVGELALSAVAARFVEHPRLAHLGLVLALVRLGAHSDPDTGVKAKTAKLVELGRRLGRVVRVWLFDLNVFRAELMLVRCGAGVRVNA
jgi:hypothetical protein